MSQNFSIPSIDTIPSVASLNLGGARKQNQNCCEPTSQSLLDWGWLKSKDALCFSSHTRTPFGFATAQQAVSSPKSLSQRINPWSFGREKISTDQFTWLQQLLLNCSVCFRHLNFQKWSDNGVFCTFCLGNVLRATTASNFSSLIWPAGSAPAALASLLFDPPEPQIIGKTQCFATFLPFHASASSFFLLFFLLIFLFSLPLPCSAFHLLLQLRPNCCNQWKIVAIRENMLQLRKIAAIKQNYASIKERMLQLRKKCCN